VCTDRCLDFARRHLDAEDVRNKRVLEVGSIDMNGTVRPFVEALEPAQYIGVDIMLGPGVDLICDAEKLVEVFGSESFDVVVSTELIEHVPNWRTVISNFKRVLRPHGVLLITTRSKGYPFHGAPYDFWRYETSDLERMLCDLSVEAIESDSDDDPGAFVRARKPEDFREAALNDLALHSVLLNRRVRRTRGVDVAAVRLASWLWQRTRRRLPDSLAEALKARLDPTRH
jgi:SAM-dependent methyltransferase